MRLPCSGRNWQRNSPCRHFAIKYIISYVKYTGELSKVAGNYRITVTGTDVVGSLVHPLEVGKLEALVGKLVDVTGWTIGSHDTATTKLLMTLAVHVEEHTASPEGKFTTEPKAFAGINPEPQTLSFNTNHAAGEVRFTIVPDDGRFIAHKLSATEVEVITQGYNISGIPVTGELCLLASDGLELDRIALQQTSMEIGSSYTWELTEGNELTDGCFPMLPNGSMIVGTPSALTWNYTDVTEKTTDAKYNRGFCFKFDSELSTKNYEGAIKTIVIRMCQTVKSKVTVLMKVNGVAVAVFGSDAALSAGKLDAFQGLKCSLQTAGTASDNDKDYITLTIDKTQTGDGVYYLDTPLAGEIAFEIRRNNSSVKQPLFIRSISIN